VHRSPPHVAPAQEFEEDYQGGHPHRTCRRGRRREFIVPGGGEGRRVLVVVAHNLADRSRIEASFLPLLQIEVESMLAFNSSTSKLQKNLPVGRRNSILKMKLTSIPRNPILGVVDRLIGEGTRWMKQLREMGYDAQDCIDLYLLRVVRIDCQRGE
jgi:hypothetical protein